VSTESAVTTPGPRRPASADGVGGADATPAAPPAGVLRARGRATDAGAGDEDRGPAGAQVVDRIVDILETFLWLGPELGVSEISRALGLKKATAHRLLASLRQRNMVMQDPTTRRYRLGGKLWELGTLATNQVDWVARVKPYLEELTAQTGETSHLAVLSDGEVLYIEKVEGSHSLRMPSQVGRRLPFHCTGVGKALVAYYPEDILEGLIARRGLARHTRNTITDAAELRKELARTRERGFSIDNEEIEDGLACVGAAIRDHTGHVVAAVSIAGPSSRLRVDARPGPADAVLRAAHSISRALGWQQEPGAGQPGEGRPRGTTEPPRA
jgi:DNA-binding IclR family transcriptional regulator